MHFNIFLFSLAVSHWLMETSWYCGLKMLWKCTECIVERYLSFPPQITLQCKCPHYQEKAVQFSDKIQDFPIVFKQIQRSIIMLNLPWFMYWAFDSSGGDSINGQWLRMCFAEITSLQKFGLLFQNCFCYWPDVYMCAVLHFTLYVWEL
jgi:hypothetical protein